MRRRSSPPRLAPRRRAVRRAGAIERPNSCHRLSSTSVRSRRRAARRGAAFREGLRDLGYVVAENLRIEARYAIASSNGSKPLAAKLVGLNFEAIVTMGPGVYAARGVTTTVPIVMALPETSSRWGCRAASLDPEGAPPARRLPSEFVQVTSSHQAGPALADQGGCWRADRGNQRVRRANGGRGEAKIEPRRSRVASGADVERRPSGRAGGVRPPRPRPERCCSWASALIAGHRAQGQVFRSER